MTGATAPASAMPMFPLGSVLLPGGILPLHVFEPRYRQLVEDCLRRDTPEFGVTLIERGSEVGGGDQRTDVGTVARIVQVGRLPDGRYAVVAVGHRRIRVREWLPDAPYPRAHVDDWPDDGFDTVPQGWVDLVEGAVRRIRRVRALAAELGDLPAVDDPDLPVGVSEVSHALVDRAPLGPADRQALLAEPHPAARVDALVRALDDLEAVLRFRLGAPGDGFGPGPDTGPETGLEPS